MHEGQLDGEANHDGSDDGERNVWRLQRHDRFQPFRCLPARRGQNEYGNAEPDK